MYTIKESIEQIKENILIEQKQIKLLKEYEEGKLIFSEENYHKLCETPFRGSKELGKKFEELFPFLNLVEKKAYCSEYEFFLKINDKKYSVFISTGTLKNISVVIPKLYNINLYSEELESIRKKLCKINETINAKTIFERANIVEAHYRKPFRILAYITHYGNKKNFIKRYTQIKEDLEKSEILAIERVEKEKIKQQEYLEAIKYFTKNFAPQLLKWTNKIIIESDRNWYSNKEYITK